MFQIFNYVGWAFGYVLWALFFIFKNFGVSIFFFTIITRLLMFPTSVKQQKSMAANSRLQAKQRELKEKYGNNKQKYNEEVQKLYAKEGASPFGGCLTSLVPMFIMLGIYYSVVRPLSNVIHIASDKMTDLITLINGIPGVNVSTSNIYHEMDILRLLAQGEKNAEIAQKLCVSENTVKYHLKNIYQKLDVKNRSQAIHRIREEQLL